MKEVYSLSLGAGKQSSAIALMIANKYEKLPEAFYNAEIIFADTKHEKPETYAWIDILNDIIPITIISREYSLLEFFYNRKQIPMGWANPLCSSHFKRDRIRAYYREKYGVLCNDGIKRLYGRNIRINEIMGIGIEEARRMKGVYNKEKGYYEQEIKWLVKHYPLVDLSIDRQKCIDIIAKYMNWSTDKVIKTIPKSSCVFCPNMSNKQLRNSQRFYPNEFEFAFEVQTRAILNNPIKPPLWKPKQSLQDIIYNSNNDNEEDDLCDSGYCFV